MQAVQLIVSGKVQGVGFRWLTKIAADKLKIKGTVENLTTGQVKIQALGPKSELDQFIALIKGNPSPTGRVDSVDISEIALDSKLQKFQVIS